MKNLDKRIATAALALTVLIYYGAQTFFSSEKSCDTSATFYVVERVIDGDTLKLSNGKKVRLIGIDTPESRYNDKLVRDAKRTRRDVSVIRKLGMRATDYTKSLVHGKRVRIERDVKYNDRYGRVLAYVYLEDGTFVNMKIIEEGYAQVMTVPPNVKHAEEFVRAEKNARDSRKGLWTEDDFSAAP